MIFINLIPFFLGLLMGSFLNVVVYRLPRGLSIVWGRSFCPKCKKKIKWFDNVPLISFILLKGRCRFCHSPISWRYPIVESVTGLLTLLITNHQSSITNHLSFFNLVCYLILAWSLIVIFFIDLEHQIIPDEIVFPNIFLFLIFHLVTNHPAFAKASAGRQLLITNYLLSALLSSLFLYLIYLITRGKGMGIGDVKLAFLMGLSLGYPKTIVAMYASFLTGAFLGLILVLVKKVKFGQKIPFGPFLSWGTIVAYIWGGKILDISQKIFF